MSALRKDQVIYVSRLGTAQVGRLPLAANEATAASIAAVLAAAAPPEGVCPAMPVAPARGPMVAFMPRHTEMTPAGPRVRRDGWVDPESRVMFRAARVADAFDVMTRQAQNRHRALVAKAEKAGQPVPVFQPPFTVGQIEVGRDYAALVERCASSGVKCSSLETLNVSGSGGGDREVAMLRDFQRLRVFERRIGGGLAKAVRRIRPGGAKKRKAIFDQALVDQVCIGGMTISEVLRAHGWAVDQGSVERCRRALQEALERMRGQGVARVSG
ncbi:hypothetical protein [Pseudooceanicola nanhaiensis]|uniref:hypothetical protein n=1 Tax=Pseudooceanicola nanhaiensis TaxID=375761 RepID=UPI001CD8114D|nr:hypothetical protein [Pseudooceanicola nanhaiensis]MCA0922190.1 hypothetical protein [Pseudooceanicola nanhaiensis]